MVKVLLEQVCSCFKLLHLLFCSMPPVAGLLCLLDVPNQGFIFRGIRGRA